MFEGFDPATREQVFDRRNKRSFILALFGHVLVIGAWAYRDRLREPEVTVQLEPEIKDFAVEEQPEPEVEEEPPPPPPDVPKPQPQAKPKPRPKPEVPKVIPEGPPPEAAKPGADKAFGTGENTGGNGTGQAKPKVEKKPEPPKPLPPKPAPPKAEEQIDPEKPVDRPEGASAPVPDPGNKSPDYPSELRDEGIEGEVTLKVHVHRDGTVKGAKILKVTSTATGEEAQTRAEKLLKAAVIAAIRTWKYTPSKYKGEPISIWLMQTIPFKLTGGG